MNDMFGIELIVPILRPFRAASNCDPLSQGVALGWIIMPLQGMDRIPMPIGARIVCFLQISITER